MSMFRTKRDVDRHVQDTFRKLKSEDERNNRCYNIAKLYYNVGEYEAARRYVSSYLAVREDSSTAHKLLGQTLEALGQKAAALAEYKCSLELNGKQQDLILKVCELIVATETHLDIGRARYWCDRAEELFPHHPAVFGLKEHLLSAAGEEDAAKLEALILSEIGVRPTDVTLRIRLLRLFLDNNRVKDAYEHAHQIESRAAFRGEIAWYECLRDVFLAYKEGFSNQLAWEFYSHYSAVMERIAVLSMQEHPYSGVKRSLQDCVQAVFLFDQTLHQASQEKVPANEQRYYEEYFTHLRGQLCLHLASLVLKRAKNEQSTWRETCRVAAPLLLGAMAPPPELQAPWLLHLSEALKTGIQLWAKEAAFRRSQAGHVVLGLVRETRTQFLEHVGRYCSGNWRERIYQRVFTARDHHHAIVTSHFVNHDSFARPPLELPSPAELGPSDEVSQTLYPSSLHHQVWLGLQALAAAHKAGRPLDFRCRLFTSLQLTCANLQSAGVETLNRLDVDTFLYAAVFCSEATHESHQASGYWARDRPPTLPAHISDQLCSVAQAEWWTAAYRVYAADYTTELGTLRQTLQQGIEVVRAIGNHGLDARLMVRLANTLSDRAAGMSSRAELSGDMAAIEARAALYWSAALPLLERMSLKKAVHAPEKRLFVYEGKELSNSELENLIQDGRLFLAVQRMKHKEYEQALQEFNALKAPHASFYASQIYTALASDELRSQPREAITSEMRSKHIILLTKARDSIYLTLDRLNSPGMNKKHPLNALVDKAVEEIESKLNRIDPDVYRNDVGREGSECESLLSDIQSAGDRNSPVGNGSLYPLLLTPRHNRKSSTPYRASPHQQQHKTNNDHPDADYRRTETRPSPERLDAQIRQLGQIVSDRDSVVQTILDQYKTLLDSQLETNRSILSELQCIKNSMGEFTEVKKQMLEMQRETARLRRAQAGLAHAAQLPPELAAMTGDKEDDMYVFDDEDYSELYTDDVNLAAAQMGQYPTFPPYPNYSNLRQITGLLGTSTVTYGQPPEPGPPPPLQLPPNMNSFFRSVDPALIYQPALGGYYGTAGALPFSEGQKLPDFRTAHVQPPPPPMVAHTMAVQPPPPEQKLLVTTAPVNVVITSSDVMPTSAPAHRPTLSVTIPPQHRLGTVPPPPAAAGETPHAFQISMPPQAPLHMATQLEKQSAALSPVLPISVNSLLVSVPSPLYSAVATDKTPPRGGPSSAHSSFGGSPTKNVSRGDQRLSTGSAAGEDDDHDAYPDFQPVIPLPAEVAANTGEEGEDVMFEARGKLYRFVEKEWKERGVGIIKFLRSKTTGKVRLLMRREQVLKICANHLVTPDMELKAMNNRAWIWVANDFADEQVRLEKLCVRFKTVEEALNFRDAFDVARDASRKAATPAKVEKRPASPGDTVSKPSPGDKISVGGFTFASTPTFKADHSSSIDEIIEEVSRSPDKAVELPKVSPFAGFSFTTSTPTRPVTFGSVKKEEVKPTIFGKLTETVKPVTFGEVKKEEVKPVTFGNVKENVKKAEAKPSPKKEGSGLMFGGPKSEASFTDLASGDFSFKKDSSFTGFAGAGASVFGSPAKRPEEGDVGEGTEEFVPTAEFVPVVPLPELVDVRTGEEGEEVLFEERAKLLRFDVDTKQWKERGVGKFKLLLDTASGRVRLLQRREQVLKVCCNHALTSYMEFNPLKTSDRAYSWYAHDYSEGEVKPELFALRFKTAEQADRFKTVVDATQAKMVDDRLPVAGFRDSTSCRACLTPNAGDLSHSQSCREYDVVVDAKPPPLSEMFKPKTGSWECGGCYTRNDGGVLACLACQTAKPGHVAKPDTTVKAKTGAAKPPPLSEMFKPKTGSWECSGCYSRNDGDVLVCPACKTAKPGHVAKPDTAVKAKAPLSELFKPKTGSWECSGCYSRNDGDVLVCPACKTAKPGHVAKPDTAVKAKAPLSELFKPKTGSWECSGCYSRNDGDVLVCPACKTAKPGHVAKPDTAVKAKAPLSELFKPKTGSWECGDCYTRNDGDKASCPACNAPGPGEGGAATTRTTSSAGSTLTFKPSPATGSFNLGSAAPAPTGFTFGVQPKFSFGVVAAPPPATSLLGSAPTPTPAAQPFRFDGKPAAGAFLFGVPAEPAPATETSFVFGTPKPTVTKPETTPTTSSFSFGASQPIAIPKAADTASSDTTGPNFTFGSPGKFEFHFQAKSPKSPGRTTSAGEDTDSEPEGDEGDHIYFQPVIPLPDKVPVCTGEEDEEVLYCHRAKLYRYAGGEWKERGIGDFKLLRHRTTRKIRLLMRRDQILKLCLNHYLSPELKFVAKDDKTWLWSAADFSEGTVQNEQFALRFKTPDIAVGFKVAMDAAMAELSGEDSSVVPSTPASVSTTTTTTTSALAPTSADGPRISPAMKAFSFNQTPAGGQSPGGFSLAAQFGGTPSQPVSVVRSLFGGTSQQSSPQQTAPVDLTPDSDVVFVEEILQVTPEEKEAALRLQLPPNFYAYLRKPPCPGCAGCDPPSAPAPPSRTPTLTELLTSAGPFAAQKAKAASTFGQQPRVSSYQTAAPIFGQNVAFTMPTAAGPVFGARRTDEGPVMTVPTSNSFSMLQSRFGFAGRPATETNGFATAPAGPEGADTAAVSFLPVDASLSFATLASAAQQPAFKTDTSKNFTWSGAGTTLFGGASPHTPKGSAAPATGSPTTPVGDDEGEAGGEDDTHDPQFEPIIALPDAIEVRTGEEDEMKLFSHRAMLYRYQTSTKEWKERGVGEMKILKHPVNNTYRLLLRREQIHKVVLNQLLTADVALKPMSTSDRAWCWGAYNHAEEPAALEELAVKFKYPETANEFRDVLVKCVAEVAAQATATSSGASAAVDGGEVEEDEDEGDEDDYEDYDEDGGTEVMFEKRATVQLQTGQQGAWTGVGMGDLQVVSVYQDDQPYLVVNLVRDGAAASSKPQLLSHIDHDTVLDLNKKSCSWSYTDYDDDSRGAKKTYMAKFSSELVAGEFFTVLSESTSHYSIGQDDD